MLTNPISTVSMNYFLLLFIGQRACAREVIIMISCCQPVLVIYTNSHLLLGLYLIFFLVFALLLFRSLFRSLEFVRLSHSLINTVLLCQPTVCYCDPQQIAANSDEENSSILPSVLIIINIYSPKYLTSSKGRRSMPFSREWTKVYQIVFTKRGINRS